MTPGGRAFIVYRRLAGQSWREIGESIGYSGGHGAQMAHAAAERFVGAVLGWPALQGRGATKANYRAALRAWSAWVTKQEE